MRRGLLSAALAVATSLLLTAAADDDPLKGFVPGETKRCVDISPTSTANLTIAGDQLITYRANARELWVTRPITTCTHMQDFDTLIVERFGTQVCRGDRFSVLKSGLTIPSAVCIFGDFQHYRKAAPAKP